MTRKRKGISMDMRNRNIKSTSDVVDLMEIIICAIGHDTVALGKITAILTDGAYTAIQRIPYCQLKKYLDGVKRVEDDLGGACKLSDKLFSDMEKKTDNAMRLYKMIISAETDKKIDYFIETTRSLLLGMIDVETMYRIFRAIVDTLPEDLEYLSNVIEKEGTFKGDIKIHALERTGLMISAGIDAELDVEEQEYYISSLGYMVDRYALSTNDENREKWYKKHELNKKQRKFSGPTEVSEEEIKTLVELL